MEYVPGPDFPTGGTILGRNGIRAAYELGRGSLIMRAKTRIEESARRPRIDHRLRDPLPGEQGAPARAHRRGGARQAGRGHRRGARRERSRRRAAGDRAQARRHGRRRAEPALSLHAAADHVRRQRAGARRRPPAADEPQGAARGVHPLPRRGHHAAHQVRAQPCPRPRPCAGRPRHRRRQHRRGDRDDPPRARPGGGARAPDGQGLAGRRRGAADRPDRRAGPRGGGRRHLPAVRGRRPAPSSNCACSA